MVDALGASSWDATRLRAANTTASTASATTGRYWPTWLRLGPSRHEPARLRRPEIPLVEHHQGHQEQQPRDDGEDRAGHAHVAEVAAHDHRDDRLIGVGL